MIVAKTKDGIYKMKIWPSYKEKEWD